MNLFATSLRSFFSNTVFKVIPMFLLLLSIGKVQAQYVNARLIIDEVSWSGYVGDKHGPRVRIYYTYQNREYRLKYCMAFNSSRSGTVLPNEQFNLSAIHQGEDSFELRIITHEERKDGGNNCEADLSTGPFNQPDKFEKDGRQTIDLNNFTPGIYSPTQTMTNLESGSQVDIKYRVIYNPPKIKVASGLSGIACLDQRYSLKAGTTTGQFTNLTGVTYEWEGRFTNQDYDPDPYEYCEYDCGGVTKVPTAAADPGDPCVPRCTWIDPDPQYSWISMGNSTSDQLSFVAFSSLCARSSLDANHDPLEARQLAFRVRAVRDGIAGPWSDANEYLHDFNPRAPVFASIASSPACTQYASGKVMVGQVSSQFDSYRYLLKPGIVSTIECNPDPVSGNCLNGSNKGGLVSGNSFTIDQVSGSTYTLFLINSGGTRGLCSSSGQPIIVQVVPALTSNSPGDLLLSCNGGSTDASFTISEGRPSTDLGEKDVKFDLYAGNSLVQTKTTNSNGATATFSSLGPNTYRMVANDGCTTPVEKSFTIKQPVKVNINYPDFSTGNATCNVPGNGKVSLSATRTEGESVSTNFHFRIYRNGYLFKEQTQEGNRWSAEGLPPGNDYSVVVSEAGGASCNSSTIPFSLSAAPSLAITIDEAIDVKCHGGNSGYIRMHGSGGSGQYDYRLIATASIEDNPARNGEFSGLTSGNYQLQVFNALPGCSDSYVRPESVVISQPSPLLAALTATPVSCSGYGDGRLASSVFGGTPFAIADNPPYRYSWEVDFGTGFSSWNGSSSEITHLDSATYRLTVEDKNGCSTTATEKITEPPVFEITHVSITDIKCFGETGALQVSASGGVGGYQFQYALQGTSAFKPFTSSTPLTAGTYIIRANDANKCPASAPGAYPITTPLAALDATIDIKQYNGYAVSCYGGKNGSVTLTPHGGNGDPYSGYYFNKDQGDFTTSPILTGFDAGNHTISVKDGRGCVVTHDITISEPPPLVSASATLQHVECFGAATGSIALHITGGVAPFTYQIGEQSPSAEHQFDHLAAGEYEFTIEDNNGCSLIYNDRIVNLNSPIVIREEHTPVSCFGGQNGAISVITQGGVAPYKYLLNDVQRQNQIDGLFAGVYHLQVIDAKGCEMSGGDISILQPEKLLVDKVTVHDIVCKNEQGTIEMRASGGITPYMFEYANASSPFKPLFPKTGLSADVYKLRVKDANGCLTDYESHATITNPRQQLDFSYTLSDYNGYNISCYGGDNGYLEMMPTGGNDYTYQGYTYSVDDEDFHEHSRIERLNAGMHYLRVKDGRGCVALKVVTLSQSSNVLSASIAETRPTRCFNEATGEIEIIASGGLTPYQYKIDQHTQSAPRFSHLAQGDYTVTVSDKNDCRTVINTAVASANPPMDISYKTIDVSCFDGNDGSVDVTVTGGVSPLGYKWNDGTSAPAIDHLKSGMYTLEVTDGAYCKTTATFTIHQPSSALAIASLTADAACYNQSNGLINMVAEGGTPPYLYSADNGSSYGDFSSFLKPTGDHTLYVKDAHHCIAKATTHVGQRNTPPQINFLAATKNYARDTVVLTEINVPKPDSVAWLFDPRAMVISDDPWSPQLKFEEEGAYSVTMIPYFGNCAYTLTKDLSLNAFDPNRKPDYLPGVKPIESLTASPNPSTGKFNIQVVLNHERYLSIAIYDLSGVQVESKHWSQVKTVEWPVDLSSKPEGVYVVRAITEPDAAEVRLVITK